MATMTEKRAASIKKELEKYNNQLIRRKALLEKKIQKAVKLGANWSDEEAREHYDTCTYEQRAAWFDLSITRDSVKEAEEHIENATKRLNAILPELAAVEAKTQEDERIEEIKTSFEKRLSLEDYIKAQEEYQRWLKWFKAECLKDGIIIDHYGNHLINGSLKNGKHFSMLINDGYTERSFHCYTLYIDNECIFTSGLFETAYKALRN